MQKIELDNFRVFGSPAGFDLAPVTVLTGKNNSGKSSLIKAFLVLADYLEQDDQTVLRLDGPRAARHKISSFDHLKNWDNTSNVVSLKYTIGDYDFDYEFTQLLEGEPAHLTRFRMVALPIGEELLLERNNKTDESFRLVARQSFIDFVTSEEVYLAEQTKIYRFEANKARESLAGIEAMIETKRAAFEKNPELVKHQAVAVAFAELNRKREDTLKRIRQYEEYAATSKPRDKGIIYDAEVTVNEHKSGGFALSRIVQQALISYVEADTTRKVKFFKFGHEEQLRNLVRFEQELGHTMRFISAHLSPNRTVQARIFFSQQGNSEISTIADVFVHKGIRPKSEADKFLRNWLPQFNVGDSVNISQIEGVAFKIVVSRKGKTGKALVNLADLGFGAGQILTVLLQIASVIQLQEEFRQSNRAASAPVVVMLIEEPESNLHPQFQSLLARLFAETAEQYGLHFVLETHSEYFIRNIQVQVKDHQRQALFKVYYLDAPTEENKMQYGHEMRLREDGIFMDDFGPGFLDESTTLTFQLF